MEKRKPAKSPCPVCAQPLAPQGVALHYQRKHPGETPPRPTPPASAPQRTESAPSAPQAPSSSGSPAPSSPSSGILDGHGGVLS